MVKTVQKHATVSNEETTNTKGTKPEPTKKKVYLKNLFFLDGGMNTQSSLHYNLSDIMLNSGL